MELRRLRELLSLENRVLVGESGLGVQSPNKLASSSSSRALSFTSPGSRGQEGALFNGISELLQADAAYGSAELPRSAAGRSARLLFSAQPGPPAGLSFWPGLLPFHPTVGLGNISPTPHLTPRSQLYRTLYCCLAPKCRSKFSPQATHKERKALFVLKSS